jgi:hypothetical protein
MGQAPFVPKGIFSGAQGGSHFLESLRSSHLPLSRKVPLVEIMSHEVSSQKHSLNISLKLIASLERPLESCIPLVSMPCIQYLVVGVYPSLQKVNEEACKKQQIYDLGRFKMSDLEVP